MAVQSFIAGRWVSGGGPEVALHDASTGSVVSHVASAGLDLQAPLAHARHVGGPRLRALTFPERAACLKALAQALNQHKEELYQLSLASGATRRDAALDVDGGIGCLFTYASKGARELPDGRVLSDGSLEGLSKSGRFIGQHGCVPREGAAVHINAFNFPVWGMLEKLAPTLLAGMPAIVKPATVTAYIAEHAFRCMIDADVLPEGALQLLCGSAAGMLEHLQVQDVVSFTGSADTARTLRTHPVLLAHAVRLNCETDSINSIILGPDARPDTAEFSLFVREVVREMTVKAGQKCTAIRKALVPAALLPDVLEALRSALEETVVGDPRLPTVSMGPLVSVAHRRELEDRVAALLLEGRRVCGDPDRLVPLGADRVRGAFVSPTLISYEDIGRARHIHELEAFGPVCGVLPFDTLDEALALAREGGGSLVASVCTADRVWAVQAVAGLAPWHGRVLVLDRDCAPDSTGHGSPLPHLIHGGPGRAGGGEELGGLRSLLHYMQRAAVQGAPDTVSLLTARHVHGSRELDPGIHPFRKTFHELRIGDTFRSPAREVTLADIEAFAALTGDHFYAHMDEAAARRNPLFGGRVAHGYFLLSAAAGLFVDPRIGPVLANYGLEQLRFTRPVKPGDRIRVRVTCKDKTLRTGKDYGEVRWEAEISNQDDVVVASYDVLTLVSVHALPDATLAAPS